MTGKSEVVSTDPICPITINGIKHVDLVIYELRQTTS